MQLMVSADSQDRWAHGSALRSRAHELCRWLTTSLGASTEAWLCAVQLPETERQAVRAGALRMKGKLQSPPRTAWGLRDVQDVLPAARSVRLLGEPPFSVLQDTSSTCRGCGSCSQWVGIGAAMHGPASMCPCLAASYNLRAY